MKEVKSLWDAAVAMESLCVELNEVISGVELLDEAIEEDGFQSERNFEEWKAIHFSRRFPTYLHAFRGIFGNLYRINNELQEYAQKAYEANRLQKENSQ